MTSYLFLLLLCPMALIGSVTRARDVHRILLAIAATVVVAMCGLRWNSDVDHLGYAELFNETPTLTGFTPDVVGDLYGEPGYLLLSSAIRSVGLGFFTMTFLCALFAVAAKAFVIQRFVRSAAIVLFLYLCIHFITIEFIQIRWAVATALLALAFAFQFQRRAVPTLVCLGLAFSIHYFSVVFLAVAALLEIRRERHLYFVLIFFGAVGALLAWNGVELDLSIETDAYILRRAIRYMAETISTVGLLSYLKVSTYPIAYLVVTAGRPELHSDPATQFLRRLSLVCVAFALALSIVPVMHHRTVVLADFFSLLLLVRVIESRFAAMERLAAFAILSIPFATWFITDIAVNYEAQTLFDYSTWIPLIF